MIRRRTGLAVAITWALLGCGGEVDLSEATTAELVEIVSADPHPTADSATAGDLRRAAARARDELDARPPEAVVLDVLPLLGDARPQVRTAAARRLGTAARPERVPGELRRQALDALDPLLDDTVDEVRMAAAWVLTDISWNWSEPTPLTPRLRETLAELLRSSDSDTQFLAAWTTERLGPEAATALVDGLLEAAASQGKGARLAAAGALRIVRSQDRIVLDALLGLLEDSKPAVRFSAAVSLGRLGARAAPAFPQLLAHLDDESEDVRFSATQTLVALELDNERTTRSIEGVLRHKPSEEWKLTPWIVALGRLAARVPGTRAAKDVRERAESLRADTVLDYGSTCALAWIACAERDVVLAAECYALLRSDFGDLDLHAEPAMIFDDDQVIVEALVELARWPEIRVDAEPLRTALAKYASSDHRRERDWARGQLARMP